jgi:ribosome-associated translation inhibitor RaiA
MNIDWTFRGEEVAEDVQDRVGRHLEKIGRLLREPVDVHIVVTHEGPTHQRVALEVVMTSPAGTFKGHGEGHEILDVSHDVLRRVEVQVHKVHDKRLESRRQSSPAERVVDEQE